MLGGLIAGALKGAGEGYATYAKGEMENQQRLDYATKILELQEQKELRVDEIRRGRDFADKKRDIEELDPMRIQSKVSETKAVGAAQTGVEVAREGELGPVKTANAVAQATALGPVQATNEGLLVGARTEAERKGQAAYGQDRQAREGVRARARDQHVESAGSAAQAGLAQFQLTELRAQSDLRKRLSQETDPAKRDALRTQLQDLTIGSSSRSYSDVVTAGDAYRKMADNLRRDAEKNAGSEEERQTLLRRAEDYEQQADYILRGAVGSRLPGGPKPKTDPSAPLPAPQTRAELERLPKGTRYTAPDGTTRTKQ